MKKSVLVLSALISVLALVLIAVNPVAAAAGFVVSTASANKNGSVVVYLEYSTTPYYMVTTTFSQGIGYPTTCSPSGAGFLKCVINGQLAKYHADQTAYIIMNGSDDNKAYFIVPELPERQRRDTCGDDQCCGDCD